MNCHSLFEVDGNPRVPRFTLEVNFTARAFSCNLSMGILPTAQRSASWLLETYQSGMCVRCKCYGRQCRSSVLLPASQPAIESFLPVQAVTERERARGLTSCQKRLAPHQRLLATIPVSTVLQGRSSSTDPRLVRIAAEILSNLNGPSEASLGSSELSPAKVATLVAPVWLYSYSGRFWKLLNIITKKILKGSLA